MRQLMLIRELTKQEEQPAVQTKFTAHMDVSLLVSSSVYLTFPFYELSRGF